MQVDENIPQKTTTLDAETFKKIQPKEYLRRFIQQQSRPDGRALNESRHVHINKSI